MKELFITEINVIPVKANRGLVGFASCIVNEQFYIGSIAIHSTLNNDFRLVFPTKALKHGKQLPCVYPINKGTERSITEAIINVYKDLFRNSKPYKEKWGGFCGT